MRSLFFSAWVILAFSTALIPHIHGDAANKKPETVATGDIQSPHSWIGFKALFKTQRKAQLEVIKSLLEFNSREKQYDMLTVLLKKMMEMLSQSHMVIGQAEFQPTDDFPEEEQLRDALSHVIQNTVLFCDFALRFPAYMHHLFDNNANLRQMIEHSISFVQETNVLEGTSSMKAIDLAQQELGLVPKSEDYRNPYSVEEEYKISDMVKEEMKKKKSKPKKKGPRISRKTEL